MAERQTVKLGTGMTVETDRPVLTLEEYVRQGREAGWRFVCPRCDEYESRRVKDAVAYGELAIQKGYMEDAFTERVAVLESRLAEAEAECVRVTEMLIEAELP